MKNVARLKASLGGFVLLRHEMPASRKCESHWDLLFETHDLLLTFRLAALPVDGGDASTLHADRLADHRNIYMHYQGEISGDRGRVQQVASGEYKLKGPPGSHVCLELLAANLRATLEFQMCDVGEATELKVRQWELANL